MCVSTCRIKNHSVWTIQLQSSVYDLLVFGTKSLGAQLMSVIESIIDDTNLSNLDAGITWMCS